MNKYLKIPKGIIDFFLKLGKCTLNRSPKKYYDRFNIILHKYAFICRIIYVANIALMFSAIINSTYIFFSIDDKLYRYDSKTVSSDFFFNECFSYSGKMFVKYNILHKDQLMMEMKIVGFFLQLDKRSKFENFFIHVNIQVFTTRSLFNERDF